MADGYLLSVGSDYMVVVATGGKAGGDKFRFAWLIGRDFVELAAAVVDESLAVGRPVRCFDPIRKFLDNGTRAVCYVQYLEDAGYLFLLRGRYCCDDYKEKS